MSADLFAAIAGGDVEAARRILADDSGAAAAKTEHGVSALMMALYHRQQAIADALADAVGQLDVFEAAALGKVDRVRELVGGDAGLVAASAPDGFTALHFAAFFDRPQVVDVLLAAGAEPSVRATGPTRVQPIHSAVAARSTEVVRRLIAAGSELDGQQEGGYTALQAAAKTGIVEMVRALLDAGADRSVTSDDGQTAADMARAAGHDEVVPLLE